MEPRTAELIHRAEAAEARHRAALLRLEELTQERSGSQDGHLVLAERYRIAQDLHDRASQTLFLLSLHTDWVLSNPGLDAPLRQEIIKLKELAAAATVQVREAIYALRASELKQRGLQGALLQLANEMDSQGIAASLSISGAPHPLPAHVEDTLFKIAQESLSNVRKHAQAAAVLISLRYGIREVALVIQDDGVGLSEPPNMEALAEGGHLGLQGMQRRVERLSGTFELEPGDEGGLSIRVTIPLREDEAP